METKTLLQCHSCSNDKVQVFHSFDGTATVHRLPKGDGSWSDPIPGDPPAGFSQDPIDSMSTSMLSLLALAILGGGRRPDAESMAKAMGGLRDAPAAPTPEPVPAKPAEPEEPKVPAMPLRSLGIHICEDGGVVVTEWPEGAHPLHVKFASRSAGHAVGYALESLQKARQEQRNASRDAPPVRIVAVDLAGGPDRTGFASR